MRGSHGTAFNSKEDEMPNYTYDHIHLRTRDPEATTRHYHEMFGAKIVESVQSDGQRRVDLD